MLHQGSIKRLTEEDGNLHHRTREMTRTIKKQKCNWYLDFREKVKDGYLESVSVGSGGLIYDYCKIKFLIPDLRKVTPKILNEGSPKIRIFCW